jgi:hypothetical protein
MLEIFMSSFIMIYVRILIPLTVHYLPRVVKQGMSLIAGI